MTATQQQFIRPAIRERVISKRSRFPYSKAVLFDDREEEYKKPEVYPKWITKREDFL